MLCNMFAGSLCDSSCEEELKFLRESDEPWEKVELYWGVTAEERLTLLVESHKEEKDKPD